MERESEKPLAMDNPGPQPTFETSYDKIQHLQQQIDVKNKDIIHYDKHAGHGIQWKDKLYHVIRIQDIVLVE